MAERQFVVASEIMGALRFAGSDGSSLLLPVTVGAPGDDPTAWGYRPPAPAGWTVIDGVNGATVPKGATRRYYRNCDFNGAVWLKDTESDLIFVDCDFYGGQSGTQGRNIWFFGCRFGGVTNLDAMQIKPATGGGVRPQGWWWQGCSFVDVIRTDGSHTDGIQFGGVLGATVRWCYFDNVAVEHILCNGWNGNPENVLVDRCYFGSRPQPGGPPIHFSREGTWGSVNCRAVGNFYDGTVASVEAGTVGCTVEGTRPSAEWTHGDPWLTY